MSAKPDNDIPGEPSSEPETQEGAGSEQVDDSAQTSAEVQKLQQDNKQLRDQLLRKQAELENFRKRTEKEKQDFMQYSLFDAVKSLLPVLDGFEFAMNADGGSDEYRKGIGLIHQQLLNILQKLGLKRIESKGREFDPRLHEAVATLETDQHPDHQIVEELQPGYSFKDRLLRPAMVTVARHSSGSADQIQRSEH
jgi:molecular chaperone GrpE